MEKSVASAWDEQSGLRLVRWRGEWEFAEAAGPVLADPTRIHLPCPSIIDVRDIVLRGSVVDIEHLAIEVEKELPRFEQPIAYLVSDGAATGVLFLMIRSIHIDTARLFTNLDAAIEHVGMAMSDYDRAEAALSPVFG